MSQPSARIRICHLSDLHLPLRTGFSPTWIFSKRLLGYANITLARSRTHKLAPLAALLSAVAAEEADLVIVTGDLTNLALKDEYARLNDLFDEAGLAPSKTIVIPGNHDRYTPGADLTDAFERNMSRWLPAGFDRRAGYPIIRRLGPVAVAALDTTVWRGPIRAAGIVRGPQLERLDGFLEDSAREGRWPLIAMHHPPFDLPGRFLRNYRTGLVGADRLRALLEGRHGTILHGHLHRLGASALGGFGVFGVPSASNDVDTAHGRLAYAVYDLGAGGPIESTVVRADPACTDTAAFGREPLDSRHGIRHSKGADI
jgi:3',5'-cyclic AMP phosphodiesterase CpdA